MGGRRVGGGRVAKANADAADADIAGIVAHLQAEGLSLRQIAERLNQDGHTTRRGKSWNPVEVARVLDRAGA